MAQWMGTPTRFADFYNGNVFDGKEVIYPEELEPIKGETHKTEEDKEGKQQEIHRYRDVIMRWKKYDVNLAILAIENQENVHLAMPVRNMMYDSLAYQEQIEWRWNMLSKEEKKKCSKKEFLSRYLVGEKLIPVITLVFYYGDEEWLENRELHEMLELKEIEELCPEMKEYVPNYKLNLVDAIRLENLNVFHSDLQQALGVLQCKGDKELLNDYISQNAKFFNNMDKETAYVIGEFLDSRVIRKAAEDSCKGERIDMCKALEDLYNDGKLEGRLEGEARFALLTKLLLEAGSQEELLRVTTDLEYREKMYEKYNL